MSSFNSFSCISNPDLGFREYDFTVIMIIITSTANIINPSPIVAYDSIIFSYINKLKSVFEKFIYANECAMSDKKIEKQKESKKTKPQLMEDFCKYMKILAGDL